ncbi:MAG: phage tail tape measure protein, partial [Clostridia bacterium]|nr:phage tail tape measure protein [Clostridia bacterium]
MADEVASLLVRITADGSQAVGVLNGIQASLGRLADSNATTMNKFAAGAELAGKVGRTITKTVGVATVAGLAAAAKEAGKLNKELANIGTLSVPTEKLKQYKGQIQDIAIATGKSTSDISEGTYQVVSAFGDAADTMEKVEINAKAAKAGLATTADSINLTSAVTKAYGDTSAAAVQKVADLAFKTVELGQTTFPELAQSMQQVTSLSKELGVSQEELFASYATLTGVTGGAAEVQTQMKAIYTALLKQSENMTKTIKKQGYASGYSMIKTLGFAGTLDALKKATNGSEEEMLGLFNNVRAMPAIMALTGAQADTFATKLGKMEAASGAATKAFEVQTEGVAKTGFTLEQAKVKMQVAAQRFGESAAPIIAGFADVVDRAADALANMNDGQ